jgi:hypothetical protein
MRSKGDEFDTLDRIELLAEIKGSSAAAHPRIKLFQ